MERVRDVYSWAGTVARYSLMPARTRVRDVTLSGNVVQLAGGPSRAKRGAGIGRRGFRNCSRDAQLLNRARNFG